MSSTPSETRQWLLSKKPTDMPELSGLNATFSLTTTALPELQDGQVLVKAIALSNDPAQRGWISANIPADRLYVPPVPQGSVMRARALGEVIDSKSDKLAKGTKVNATIGWAEYAVLKADDCVALNPPEGIALTHYLGAFGAPGLTAYYGLCEVASAGKDDVVVVSGAAGATGSMVVQIAKRLVGCKKVIGIAGSDEKCKWVEGSMGADVCLNYKKDSFKKDLERETDGFVDVFFDGVGGEILDLMLTRMKRHGRIAACGAISNYNSESAPTGLKNWFEVISNRINIKGFIVLDYLHKMQETMQIFTKALQEGKLKIDESMETVVDTKFEDIPKTWMKLFEGGNQGKLVTQLV